MLGGALAALLSMASRSLLVSRSQSLWAGYCDHLARKPLVTKALTGVVGTLIGDGIAQYSTARASGERMKYDAPRASRLCVYAALIGTPVGHYWFGFLDKFILPHAMRSPLAAIIKTLLDQTIMAPAGIGLFFYAMSLLEGSCPADAMIAARERFKPTLMANYALWPAANLINFAFVPPSQRILYVNVIYVFWASFLSAMANSKAAQRDVAVQGALLAGKEL